MRKKQYSILVAISEANLIMESSRLSILLWIQIN
jgi:hypothetical protein